MELSLGVVNVIDVVNLKNGKVDSFIKQVKREKNYSDEFKDIVKDIINDVKLQGDKALYYYTDKFDNTKLDALYVNEKEIEEAINSVDKGFIEVLREAKDNIEKYHKRQLKDSWFTNEEEGKVLGQLYNPIEKVGIYVPGGSAAYPSSVLMNVIPAKVAGVNEIIMATPPGKDGKVNKDILVAAYIVGIDQIIKVGGAQGIAALAFGTDTIPKVHKIVGPGNIYVATAKSMVYGDVDIDMIAGPSEILIIADESANPRYLAADMLSQAEHDNMASAKLVTTSGELVLGVKEELKNQLKLLERGDIAEKSLGNYGKICIVDDIYDAVKIANEIAPEHLELMVKDPFNMMYKIKNAGAIFLGQYAPEPLGDYWAGPNHVLPTGGTAKFFSPLGVDDFVKKSSIIYYDKGALYKDKDKIIEFAQREGLTAHGNSIKVRFE